MTFEGEVQQTKKQLLLKQDELEPAINKKLILTGQWKTLIKSVASIS